MEIEFKELIIKAIKSGDIESIDCAQYSSDHNHDGKSIECKNPGFIYKQSIFNNHYSVQDLLNNSSKIYDLINKYK